MPKIKPLLEPASVISLNKERQTDLTPFGAVFALSLIFNFIALQTNNTINHDGIFYIDAAKAFIREGVRETFEVYSWPFFSIIVATLHKLTGLSLETTAHTINAIFVSTACVMFLKLYQEITENKKSLWVAAFIILSFASINKYRADIMRDSGYWFFFLTSLYFFIKNFHSPTAKTAIYWQIFSFFAFLFRVEGLFLILYAPLAMLFKNTTFSKKLKTFFQLYSIYAGALISILIYLAFQEHPLDLSYRRFLEIQSYLNPSEFINRFNLSTEKLGAIFYYEYQNLDKYFSTLALILSTSLLTYLLIKLITCLSFPYFFILIYSLKKRLIPATTNNKLILFIVSGLTLFLFIYSINTPLLTPRYTTTIVLLLLLLITQSSESIIKSSYVRSHKGVASTILFIILTTQIAAPLISTSGDSKAYIREAGLWIKENISNNTPMITNEFKAAYYTDKGHSEAHTQDLADIINQLKNKTLPHASTLIIVFKKDFSAAQVHFLENIEQSGHAHIIKTFKGKKGKRALIYKVT